MLNSKLNSKNENTKLHMNPLKTSCNKLKLDYILSLIFSDPQAKMLLWMNDDIKSTVIYFHYIRI